ncbi:hypothetical protein EV200_102697 [Pedobacter psychrotolerans]|uniref:Carboxypeptidase-like protein n=2 Tax=Pedobacter psychrotolerans TaxID=1843235 RepID=A0A4R2HIY2_9SPHI|nr:hypothetical protein [Pedobacter psychrotolerans]TCO29274.1 hypothetical protein EV200_102697 [Pedobacter psychrotolerans]
MKIFKLSLLLLLLMLTGNMLKAQDLIIKGVVFEKGTNIRVALAEITNQRTQLGVGSNDLGFFQIQARVGDTLLITKRSLNDQQIVVRGTQDILIYLVRGSTTLDEVTIVGSTKKQDLEDLKRDFRNKGVYNGGKSSVLSSVFHPLNGLYNLIGKDPKNARRFNRYADNELKQTQIDQYFNGTIIQNNTDLRGKDLETFMLNYRPDFEKAQHWNVYDYIKYIKESAKKFEENPVKTNDLKP